MAKRFHWYFPQNCTNFVSNSFSSRQNKQTNSSFDASAGKCKFVLLLYKILNIEEGHYKSELDRKIWKLGTKYISNLICVSLPFNFDHGQDLLQHLRLQHWPDTLHVQLLCHPHLLLLLLRLLRLPPTRQHHLQHLLPILLLLLGHPNHPSNCPPQLPFLLRLPLLFSPAMYRPHYKVK